VSDFAVLDGYVEERTRVVGYVVTSRADVRVAVFPQLSSTVVTARDQCSGVHPLITLVLLRQGSAVVLDRCTWHGLQCRFALVLTILD
jgi:hypothetical protein